jgi:hypothetical protein
MCFGARPKSFKYNSTSVPENWGMFSNSCMKLSKYYSVSDSEN